MRSSPSLGGRLAIVCSSCDAEPAPEATAGAKCPSCGEPLIAVDTRDDLVGTTIDGRFQVLAPIGAGGMGKVYRAEQLSIGREVALKVLDRRIERDVMSVKRFFREAKVASALAHPNTVPIIDFGQSEEGRLYLVMELVRGRTLADEIAQVGALSVARCVTIGIQLCDALEVAHGISIVHRDLKLENVMLVELPGRDHVKILDFGLARALSEPAMQMTATGMIAGTPRYMPPEVAFQAAAPAPDQDMYSIGVILAELAIGRELWVAPTMEALFVQKLQPDDAIVDVPPALAPLVRALLANEPEARPTAIAAREMLRRIVDPAAPTPGERDGARGGAAGSAAASPVTRTPRPLEVAATATRPAGKDTFANLSLVALDELAPPAAPAVPAATSLPTTLPVRPAPRVRAPIRTSDDPFDAPKEIPVELALDPRFDRSKRARMRRPPAVAVVRRSSGSALLWLIVVAVAIVGGLALYTYVERRRERARASDVTIEIEADRPTRITIDGEAAGTTPTSVELKSGTTPVLIEGDGVLPRQVIPDRDQAIRLQPLKAPGAPAPGAPPP